MKKSEMIRAALNRVRQVGGDGRVCYCTPSREMVFSVEAVVQNNLAEFQQTAQEPRHVVAEMMSSLAEKLREATGRTSRDETLHDFDEEDSSAALALDDAIVEEAFEKTALMYEEQGQ
jgi:hypothetical protein